MRRITISYPRVTTAPGCRYVAGERRKSANRAAKMLTASLKDNGGYRYGALLDAVEDLMAWAGQHGVQFSEALEAATRRHVERSHPKANPLTGAQL